MEKAIDRVVGRVESFKEVEGVSRFSCEGVNKGKIELGAGFARHFRRY